MIGDVTIGIQALARGTRLLNKPGVRIYVIVPLCINLLLFGALIWYGYSLFYPGGQHCGSAVQRADVGENRNASNRQGAFLQYQLWQNGH